jgi:hypothetical protein
MRTWSELEDVEGRGLGCRLELRYDRRPRSSLSSASWSEEGGDFLRRGSAERAALGWSMVWAVIRPK